MLRISEVADGRSGAPALKSKLSKTGSLASAGRTPTVGQPPKPLAARFSAGVARNNDYRREGYPDGKITQNGAKATTTLIPALATPWEERLTLGLGRRAPPRGSSN